MALTDLLPELHALARGDKLQAIRFLAEELMEEEKLLSHFQPGASYPIYSPHEAFEAAARLQELLENERAKS